jgi:uncharacterized protein (TIGR00730 family)
MLRRIAVFCGSSPGARPAYADAARALARCLVHRKIGLVYGGSRLGIMGILADTVLEAGGQVIGVMPDFLVRKEAAHRNLPDLRIVDSMHDRKALMAELSDAFLAMPGGFGTFEEICEAVTWTQLGLQHKACGLLNVEGYYDRFLAFLDHAVIERFLRIENRELVIESADPDDLVQRLSSWTPLPVDKWIDKI